ncbi:uncharacterized protein K489DRAFT_193905 [Dissoconium aciculare CBS 342.82]|uniref:Uncharacterized protein n=1 Tax=Dissoconium aciculare CBS 342.82 TaxID=1314786 RepID=A0A6J3M5N3_9PEZI|nr:uncharacterized protein K489DRAFT_193905 [Dissoconium aciculare CBS 342.82]KAF1823371.1 hypothetical protein K489DRAFT_193905 [Dissoconium aciculare CBS 342.82]
MPRCGCFFFAVHQPAYCPLLLHICGVEGVSPGEPPCACRARFACPHHAKRLWTDQGLHVRRTAEGLVVSPNVVRTTWAALRSRRWMQGGLH